MFLAAVVLISIVLLVVLDKYNKQLPNYLNIGGHLKIPLDANLEDNQHIKPLLEQLYDVCRSAG